MTKPITPKDVESAKTSHTLPLIIEAANELIVEKWNGYNATFTLRELGTRARAKLGMQEDQEFERGQLDIEPIFRKAGWIVEYDRPGYNENYEAHFIFKKRRMR